MFSDRNGFFMTLLLFIRFVLASIWKWHALVMYFIYGIEESGVSRENLCYNIWYVFKDKQLRCENDFYHVFITVRGMTLSRSPLITLCYSPFLRTFIYLTIFHSVQIFYRFIPLVSVYAIKCVC